jgi:hypothetical protein
MKELQQYASNLIIIMSVIFFIVLVVFSYHIQPQAYKVLRCNAGSTLFCPLDNLIPVKDSVHDKHPIYFSAEMEVSVPPQPSGTVIMLFDYLDASTNKQTYTVTINYQDTPATSGSPVTENGNIVMYLSPDSGTIYASISNITSEYMASGIFFILYTALSDYVFIEYGSDDTTLKYGLKNHGSGPLTISESSGTIFGSESITLTSGGFESLSTTLTNVNNGFIDIKRQQAVIASGKDIASCYDPGFVSPHHPGSYKFDPGSGLYLPSTQTVVPGVPIPLCTASITTNCGYAFVNSASNTDANSNGNYQSNHIYYNTKSGPDSADTYNVGYKGPTLASVYGSGAVPSDVVDLPQLQTKVMCGGFNTTTPATNGYSNDNYNNINYTTPSASVVNGTATAPQFSRFPRLKSITEPIDLSK